MASSTPELSHLQRALNEGLAGGTEFYLTGGGALSGFYLLHRQSQDLDFFVVDPAELDALERRLEFLCAERGWSIEEVRRFPGFRRFIVRDAVDETVIDTVHDSTPPRPRTAGWSRSHYPTCSEACRPTQVGSCSSIPSRRRISLHTAIGLSSSY